jgi:ElaA protein
MIMHLDWQIKPYNELSLNEFHDLIALRIKVFVIEQDCPYQDLDGKDKKAYHVICRDGKGNIIATARILGPGVSYPEVSIGRVVVDESYRKNNVGDTLMEKCLSFIQEEFETSEVTISAQEHLKNFYAKHHFKQISETYMEDNIPHIKMTTKTTL